MTANITLIFNPHQQVHLLKIKNRAGEVVHQGTTPQSVVLKAGAGYFKGEKYQLTFTTPSTKVGKKVIPGKKQTFVFRYQS